MQTSDANKNLQPESTTMQKDIPMQAGTDQDIPQAGIEQDGVMQEGAAMAAPDRDGVMQEGAAMAAPEPKRFSTAKKVIASIVAFIVVMVAFSAIILIPYYNSHDYYYLDTDLRDDVAGTIDYMVCGASHAINGFDPRIIDDELGVCSYNLSSYRMTIYGREYMLRKEMARNPVETVVIEITYQTMSCDESTTDGLGDTFILAKCESFGERIAYLAKYCKLHDWVNTYSRNMAYGIAYLKDLVVGNNVEKVDWPSKGYVTKEVADVTIPETQVASLKDSQVFETDPIQVNIDEMDTLIDFLQEQGVRIIVTTTPMSDRTLWTYDDLDGYNRWMSDYCAKRGIEFYDFNLLKGKSTLLSDTDCYYDEFHLAEKGAKVFTHAFCDVMNAVNAGLDVSNRFYGSYVEAKAFNSYAQR